MIRGPRRGFTLIELLVVMAIISILADAVSCMRRGEGRQTSCLSNNKQIGTAWMIQHGLRRAVVPVRAGSSRTDSPCTATSGGPSSCACQDHPDLHSPSAPIGHFYGAMLRRPTARPMRSTAKGHRHQLVPGGPHTWPTRQRHRSCIGYSSSVGSINRPADKAVLMETNVNRPGTQ